MKHMSKEELKSYGDTLPLGGTFDAQSNMLTYKNSDGTWRGFSNEDIDKERARLKQVRKQLKRSRK